MIPSYSMLAQIIVIAILHFIQIPITTSAFSLYYSPSVHRCTEHHVFSQKNKVLLFGSIYAPNGKDGDDTEEGEGGGDRDHLGMKRSSNGVQPIASWASTHDSSSTATTNPDDIQQAVEEAVSQASKLEENKDASTPAKTKTTLTQRINVRFINFDTMGGLEKVSVVVPGTNILKVADEAGIRIPRQCRTGLCGSCTADVKDPTWTDGERIGFQTIRTCQAGAMLPAGCDEMVVDLFRMARDSDTTAILGQEGGESMRSTTPRLPNNFEDGWEAEFTPDYKTGRSSSSTRGVAIERGVGGQVQVLKNTTPEYTVKQGRASSIEIDKPHWTPRIDANIPPWECIY